MRVERRQIHSVRFGDFVASTEGFVGEGESYKTLYIKDQVMDIRIQLSRTEAKILVEFWKLEGIL